jgi:hypothetical protein
LGAFKNLIKKFNENVFQIENNWKTLVAGIEHLFIASGHCVNFLGIFRHDLDFFQPIITKIEEFVSHANLKFSWRAFQRHSRLKLY